MSNKCCNYTCCDKWAVAYSVLGVPLCLEHAEVYGTYTFMPEYADFLEQLKKRGLDELAKEFGNDPI